ncbi:MAG TPA: hypothetical protein VHP83_14580, partial [Aggregatilineaceae bacterium]|nr:hypothetical protein [Aggregatilineaceae bacterium]
MLYFLVLLIGYSYTTIRISAGKLDGNMSGELRLAFLAGMPMVVTVVYRLVLERLSAAIDEVAEYAEAVSRPQPAIMLDQPTPPRPARGTPAPTTSMYGTAESMTLLKALGIMLEKEDPEAIPRQITLAVANVLKADITALVSPEDQGWADIVSAYDNIKQRQIPGLAINLEEQPTMAKAIQERAQKKLVPDRDLDELVDLYTRLDVSQLGPAYLQPMFRAGQMVGVLVVALPYSNRELQENETGLLEGLGPVAARLLVLSKAAQQTRVSAESQAIQAIVEGATPGEVDQGSVLAARQEMQQSLELAQQQIAELSHLVRDLQVELDYERNRMAQLVEDSDESLTISQRIATLSQERAELAAERHRLSQALQEAHATLVSATAQGDEDVYTTMIETLRHERDELQVQKTKLERHLEDIRTARETTIPNTLRDMLNEMSEEKARLSLEKDEIRRELDTVQNQLSALGFEGGPLAVAKALGQLTEERAYYRNRAERIGQERDLLLAERTKLEEQIQREAEREAQMGALEAELRRLAADREAMINQRDLMRTERDELAKARDNWSEQRGRVLVEMTGLQA